MKGKFDELDYLVEIGNGYLVTSTVLENGISKPTLADYVNKRHLDRVAHGIYRSQDMPLKGQSLDMGIKRVPHGFDQGFAAFGVINPEAVLGSGFHQRHGTCRIQCYSSPEERSEGVSGQTRGRRNRNH